VLAEGTSSPTWRQVFAKGVGAIGTAAAERRSIVTDDELLDPRFTSLPDAHADLAASLHRAVVAVPLIADDHVIGVLAVGGRTGRLFGADEVRMAEAFADEAVLALEKARLFAETHARRREAEVVAEVARSINASLDIDTVLRRISEAARELCHSDQANIALRVPGTDLFPTRAWSDAAGRRPLDIQIEPGKGAGGLVLATGRPFRTVNYAEDPRITKEYLPWVQATGFAAHLVVPIRIGERIEGLLYANSDAPSAFTEREESILLRLADQAAIAIRNATLFQQAQSASERLQALSRRLVEIQEGERGRLARELHDEIGQALTAVTMNLHVLRRASAKQILVARVDESLAIVGGALEQVRNLSLALRPSVLDDLGLVAALRWWIAREAARAGLQVDIQADWLPLRPSPEIETACFRIAQEAMTNVVRHARATRVRVALAGADGVLEVTVRDDGVGFDVPQIREHAPLGRSLGVLGMEERARLVGGHLEIESGPGRGTLVRARLPV
jgi:signal transduction histidine kinase